jgi:hypothetical protein
MRSTRLKSRGLPQTSLPAKGLVLTAHPPAAPYPPRTLGSVEGLAYILHGLGAWHSCYFRAVDEGLS